jgi:superfamily II DNA or RNA helicase
VSHEKDLASQIEKAEAELAALGQAREQALARLAALRAARTAAGESPQLRLPIANDASAPRNGAEKIRLFRALFRGRKDVFPKRWENAKQERSGYAPACANEWVRGVCEKPKVRCGECPNQAFIAVEDRVIADHLGGKYTAGVYPLLPDDTCWFVVLDFDEASWTDDVAAFVETCRGHTISPAVERSRSGNGAHVWFFFTAPIPARDARDMASFLLTETMRLRRGLKLESYDRLFPSQDTLPQGGFGNLIALPFQFHPRKLGHSLLVDSRFEAFPWEQQWQFLAGIERIGDERARALAKEAVRTARVLAIPLPSDEGEEEDEAPWKPTRLAVMATKLPFSVPPEIKAVLAQRLFVEKAGLPTPLISRLRRIAAFQNPEFYKRQKLRLSTGRTPRIVVCAEDLPKHLALPRACIDDVRSLLEGNGSRLTCDDQRDRGRPVALTFVGTLTDEQQAAVQAMLAHDLGVLVGPPGAGKTVMGAAMVAARGVNTLVLVHRRPLLEQWVNQLALFLGIDPTEIGRIGGGKTRATGTLDVAMIQSLVREGQVSEAVSDYGQVVVDECHHVPAVSFERVLASVRAQFIVGLTATPRRRDGHHPIGTFQLGPARHVIDAKAQAAMRPFEHRLIVRETDLVVAEEKPSIQAIFRAVAGDRARGELVARDVQLALEEGRWPIVLTERKDHLELLCDLIRGICPQIVVLRGGPGSGGRARSAAVSLSGTRSRVIVATGRYVGEGFDDPTLDTLFLAMPISWKGTVIQYAGRIQRLHPGKREVRIYDYVDRNVPVLDRMFRRRLAGYRSIGYVVGELPPGYGEADDDWILGRGWAGDMDEDDADEIESVASSGR